MEQKKNILQCSNQHSTQVWCSKCPELGNYLSRVNEQITTVRFMKTNRNFKSLVYLEDVVCIRNNDCDCCKVHEDSLSILTIFTNVIAAEFIFVKIVIFIITV